MLSKLAKSLTGRVSQSQTLQCDGNSTSISALVHAHISSRGYADDAGSTDMKLSAQDEQQMIFMQSVLSKFLPKEEFAIQHNTASSPRIRFADLPATRKFMSSFMSTRLPTMPVYDLPSYLERSYPQHNLRPRSPFYHWEMWADTRLGLEQYMVYKEFDKYWRQKSHREQLLEQSRYELARLWDWQHRRLAAGLPPEVTEQELNTTAQAPPKTINSLFEEMVVEEEQEEVSSLRSVISSAPSLGSSMPTGSLQALEKKLKSMVNEEQRRFIEQDILLAARESEHADPGEMLMKLLDRMTKRVSSVKADIEASGQRREKQDRLTKTLQQEFDERAERDAQKLSLLTIGRIPKPKASEAKLKPLPDSALASAFSGVQTWDQVTPDMLVKDEHVQVEEEVEEEDESLQILARELDFKFHLSKRPPTTTLDLLTDFLQVKYADVLMRKDYTQAVLAQMHSLQESRGASCTGGSGGSLFSGPAPFPGLVTELSPQEVAEVNREADELFRTDLEKYREFVTRLANNGLLHDQELDNCLRAADMRAAELESLGGGGQAAGPVTAQERDMLLSVLAGEAESSCIVLDGTALEARELWGEAAGQFYTTWSKRMRAEAEKELEERRLEGELSADQVQKILSVWDTPPSFEEAQAMWARYTALSTVQDSPSLEEVIVTAHTARSATASPEDHSAVAEASRAAVAQMNERLRCMYEGFQQTGLSPLTASWGDVQAENTTFESALGMGAERMFPKPKSVTDVLREHWEGVGRRFLGQQLDWRGPAWEDLFQLMKKVYTHCLAGSASSQNSFLPPADVYPFQGHSPAKALLTPTPTPSPSPHSPKHPVQDAPLQPPSPASPEQSSEAAFTPTPSSDSPEQPLEAAASQPIQEPAASSQPVESAPTPVPSPDSPEVSVIDAADPEQAISRHVFDDEVWQANMALMQSMEGVTQRNLGPKPRPPPYKGAEKIVKFTQTFVLHTLSSSKQHEDEVGITLTVGANQLKQHCGLSDSALKHIIKICSPERYNRKTGLITLTVKRYLHREENRKAAMQLLHTIIHEGQSKYPSECFSFCGISGQAPPALPYS